MSPWLLWLIAAVVLGIAEILTTSLLLGMIAGGAAAAALVTALGVGPAFQFGAFAAVSFALLVFVRPIATRHLHAPSSIRTGIDALVGIDATVVAEVTARDGRVKIGGEIWSARSYDGASTFSVGQQVQVIKVDGAAALVG